MLISVQFSLHKTFINSKKKDIVEVTRDFAKQSHSDVLYKVSGRKLMAKTQLKNTRGIKSSCDNPWNCPY